MFKTLLSLVKIQDHFKNNFYFKTTHYFVNKYLYFPFLLNNAKCNAGQRDKKHFKTGLHTDTW